MKVLNSIKRKREELSKKRDEIYVEIRIASKLDYRLEVSRLEDKIKSIDEMIYLLYDIELKINDEIAEDKNREDYVNASDNDSRSGDKRIEESAFNPPDEKKLVYTRDNPFREVD